MSLALIPLCQACRRPLEVYEQLRLIEDSLAWLTIVEACLWCDEPARTDRSLRVEVDAPNR